MRGARWAKGVLFAAAATVPAGLFAARHRAGDDMPFLPGRTSDGHHQIEARCQTCHTPFSGVRDEACRDCHEASLRARGDAHAPFKFADPGKAAMLRVVDARSCVPCHREHRPEARDRGSVTVTSGFCVGCHPDVARERPSHAAFTASSCASAACHNYHDNRALNREYLLDHRGEPAVLPDPRVPVPTADGPPDRRLAAASADHPRGADQPSAAVLDDWARSGHAAAGVNCTGCHGAGTAWRPTVADDVCARCHGRERDGFRAGKHGMRLAVGLSSMSPAHARLDLRADAQKRTLGCTTCHGAHAFDRRAAAVDACEGCHQDAHTRAYRDSPHHATWRKETAREAPPGTGVSCATCHQPRLISRRKGHDVVSVQHNQNDSLRPSTRMVRDVCARCHGVGFSLAALADQALVERNFAGRPRPALTGMNLVEGTGP